MPQGKSKMFYFVTKQMENRAFLLLLWATDSKEWTKVQCRRGSKKLGFRENDQVFPNTCIKSVFGWGFVTIARLTSVVKRQVSYSEFRPLIIQSNLTVHYDMPSHPPPPHTHPQGSWKFHQHWHKESLNTYFIIVRHSSFMVIISSREP